MNMKGELVFCLKSMFALVECHTTTSGTIVLPFLLQLLCLSTLVFYNEYKERYGNSI
jgi:hypothetical protein